MINAKVVGISRDLWDGGRHFFFQRWTMSDARGFPLPQTGGLRTLLNCERTRRERIELAGSWEVGCRSYVATVRLLTPCRGGLLL